MSKLSTVFDVFLANIIPKQALYRVLRKRGMIIGKNCDINRKVIFGTEPYLISIGDKVRITEGVKFITHDGGLWVPRNMGLIEKSADKMGRIIIGNNVNIGWNVLIMPGVTIGDNVIIGAGAIVTKDIPSNSVAVGIPAKVIETIEEYTKKNTTKIVNTKGMSAKSKKEFLYDYFKMNK